MTGPEICKKLKQMREALAKANGLHYEPVDCPGDSLCAGTCSKCDAEMMDLHEQLRRIPEEKRVYPFFYIKPEELCEYSKPLRSKRVKKHYYDHDVPAGENLGDNEDE